MLSLSWNFICIASLSVFVVGCSTPSQSFGSASGSYCISGSTTHEDFYDCISSNPRNHLPARGFVAGALVGGLLGASIDDDDRIRGATIGALVGGFSGYAISRHFDAQTEVNEILAGVDSRSTLPNASDFDSDQQVIRNTMSKSFSTLTVSEKTALGHAYANLAFTRIAAQEFVAAGEQALMRSNEPRRSTNSRPTPPMASAFESGGRAMIGTQRRHAGDFEALEDELARARALIADLEAENAELRRALINTD